MKKLFIIFISSIFIFYIGIRLIDRYYYNKHYANLKSYVAKDGTMIFNVVGYGANPNDDKDDSDAIYKAINDARSIIYDSIKVIYFPRGRYNIKNQNRPFFESSLE